MQRQRRAPVPRSKVSPPIDVPPPTPVKLSALNSVDLDSDAYECSPPELLVPLLQTITRPAKLQTRHLAAAGVHVVRDVPLQELVPDPAVLPDFALWDALDTKDDALDLDAEREGQADNMPGALFYFERKEELQVKNQLAFHVVLRTRTLGGYHASTRLGNSFEFYKHLNQLAAYWDDPSDPLVPLQKTDMNIETGAGAEAEVQELNLRSSVLPDLERATYRKYSGSSTPAEIRQACVIAFLRMVMYEFKCNITVPHAEPRLQLRECPELAAARGGRPLVSYFNAGCTFGFQLPKDQVDARRGIVDGPLFALSTRGEWRFETELEKVIDLSREIQAALITAQHRSREGKQAPPKPDAWWCTKERWGGGRGGPIGREAEVLAAKKAKTRPRLTSSPLDNLGSLGDDDYPSPKNSVPKGQSHGGSRIDVQAIRGSCNTPTATVSSPNTTNTTTNTITTSSNSLINDNLPSFAEVSGSQPQPQISGAQSQPPQQQVPLPQSQSQLSPNSHSHPLTYLPPPQPRRLGCADQLDPSRFSVYDRYRSLQPPRSSWDDRVRYMALGRAPGASVDEIFVVSSLYHHISFLRVTVPLRLLEILDGKVFDGSELQPQQQFSACQQQQQQQQQQQEEHRSGQRQPNKHVVAANTSDRTHNIPAAGDRTSQHQPQAAQATPPRQQQHQHQQSQSQSQSSNKKAKPQKLPEWGKLMVRRSKWFDLFVDKDRVEAMKHIWGIMSWSLRNIPDDVAPTNTAPVTNTTANNSLSSILFGSKNSDPDERSGAAGGEGHRRRLGDFHFGSPFGSGAPASESGGGGGEGSHHHNHLPGRQCHSQ